MKLKLIAYPEFFKGEEKLVSSLINSYDITFHLRKPGATENEYRAYLNKVPEEFHPRIILHDAFVLCSDYKIKGVHFSTKNRSEMNHFSSEEMSTSCHSITAAEEWGQKCTSLFLSPVYPSISKQGYNTVLDKTALKTYLSQKRNYEVYALGGIDASRILETAEMGFDGCAVLGAVWGVNPEKYKEIEDRLKHILACLKNVPIA